MRNLILPVLFLLPAALQSAGGMEILPARPNSCDAVTLRISRQFSSDCGWSVKPQIQRHGDAIHVLLELSGNFICLPVAREISFDVPLGQFAAGSYTLQVEWSDQAGQVLPDALAMEVQPGPAGCRSGFRRGDVNGDGGFDVADAVGILIHLFLGGELDCQESADADGNAKLELTDAVYLLTHLFLGGSPPPSPYPECGRPPLADGFVFGCDKASCDAGPGNGEPVWMFLPDGCMQCEPCAALGLKEVVQNLANLGIEVIEAREGGLAVCEACTVCPSGRVFLIRVDPSAIPILEGFGWKVDDGNIIGGR